jgi:hypothetical protein
MKNNTIASHNVHNTIPEVSTKYGAPMGRMNIGNTPHTITSGRANKIYKCNQIKIYDKRVPMSPCGAYDKGGAYWGIGKQLRVRFTADLSYIEFYRMP